MDVDRVIDTLARWCHDIRFTHQLVQNNVSSTKVRLFLRCRLSMRYLLPVPTMDYIEQHGLYMDDCATPNAVTEAIQAERETGKEKEMGMSSSVAGG